MPGPGSAQSRRSKGRQLVPAASNRIAGSLAALSLLAACASTPPERALPALAFEIPRQWVAAAAGTPATQAWWSGFADSQLGAYISEAIRANHDLKVAAARVAGAEADARVAAADLWPQLRAGADAARARQGVAVPAGTKASATTSNFGASLDLSWEIDLWGRIRSGAQGALADLDAQRAGYAAAALSLAAQTAKVWYALTEARLQLDLARATAASYAQTAQRAIDRVEAGVQAPIDRHLAEANLAAARATMQQRDETLRRVTRQFEVLLGRYPAGAVAGGAALPTLAPPAADIPAEVLRRRPDLRAAELRLAAAGLRIDAARAALLPRLSLTATAGSASSDLGDLFSGSLLWTIAGNLVQPLFEGGRLRARVDLAQARERELYESYAQSVLQALVEVETALAVGSVLAEREAALSRAVDAARAAITVAENRYREGVESFLVVLESQRRAFDSESALLAVRGQRLENRIDLHLALGDGYEELLRRATP